MTDKNLIAILALQKIPFIGDIIAKKLIQSCGNASAVFKEKKEHLLKINGIGSHIIKDLHNPQHFREAEKELAYIRKHNIKYWYYEDLNYPWRLKHCVDAPILFFYEGNIKFKDERIISIVGTRNMSSYGASVCEKIIKELLPFNPVIVSGFAFGVDITAHKIAMNNNLQTVACMAHGLDQIYPRQHMRYVSRMKEKGGFITDFHSGTRPNRENFLKRNRIIAGLSEGTIVIESASKGGSLVTADIAFSYNREVFAVPGNIHQSQSSGCNDLIKSQKAHLLSSAADLVYVLGWEHNKIEKKPIQKQLFVDLNPEEQKIYDYISSKGKTLLDSVALGCNFPIHKTSSILLAMELKGVIKPFPGKLFDII